jgi:hypothetical protein
LMLNTVVLRAAVSEFLGSCSDRSQVMGCIRSHDSEFGQQSAVVLAARAMHVLFAGQQKSLGRPWGQERRLLDWHVSSRLKSKLAGLADAV